MSAKPTDVATWQHNALADDLATHLGAASDRMVWTNLQLGPSGSARPDVYTLAKSYSRPAPRAYEIKVSVADFRRDVTAGKWIAYREHAEQVYFAVPSGLVTKNDLPAEVGLLVRGPEGWRAMRAPKSRPVEIPVDTLLKLLFDGRAKQFGHAAPERGFSSYLATRELAKRWGEEAAQLVSDTINARERLARLQTEITQQREREEERARRTIACERRDLVDEQRAAASAVGLAPDAPLWEIVHALREARQRIDRDAEVQRLNGSLERVRSALEHSEAPVLFGRASA